MDEDAETLETPEIPEIPEIPETPADFFAIVRAFGAHNYRPLPVVLTRGEGAWVWDVAGNKYLDCLSSYSAINQGHRHPKILAALQEQMARLTLTSRAFYNDQLGPFLRKLCRFCDMEVALPMNTGAEAVETGIKIARRWGYRKKGVPAGQAEILVAEHNFHGRTTTIVGFSSDENSRAGFGPPTPGFKSIPFNDPAALESAITPDTVAFLVEPIQGEAGVIVPDPGYLRAIRQICTDHDVLLVLDEIQTGFGRTGKNFAFQHENAVPDVLLLGKALGGGVYPVSAAVTRWDVMDVITPGSHGSTFGGNPLACAVGSAVLDLMVEERLAERAARLGPYFMKRLRALGSPKVKEVRGKGLLLAVEIQTDAGRSRPLVERLLQEGVLAKDTHEQSIRFAPPLVVDEATLDWAVERIALVLRA